jgi:hypothetical protein
MGTNTPLIKIRGNLIMLCSIIILDGLSVGGAEISRPREEKQKAAIMVPATRLKLIISTPSKTMLIIKIKKVINRPNIRDANISPRIIAHNVIGAETNLSKVFILVSQGAITGPMDETVTKSVIPSNPGIRKLKERFLPKAKAINKKDGISIPDINTGPFK